MCVSLFSAIASRIQCKDSALHTLFSNMHTHTHSHMVAGQTNNNTNFVRAKKDALKGRAPTALCICVTASPPPPLYPSLFLLTLRSTAKALQRFMDSMRVLSRAQKKGLSFHLVSRARYSPTHTHKHTHKHAHMHTHKHTKWSQSWSWRRVALLRSGLTWFSWVWFSFFGCLAVSMRKCIPSASIPCNQMDIGYKWSYFSELID